MHQALSLLLLFFIGSMIGWVLEFFFRRYFAPEKKMGQSRIFNRSVSANLWVWHMYAVFACLYRNVFTD